ncbi:glycosyltransferase family 2 protein [Winogradskyella litoriviva]|uniref:Glycosyltransferase family 2 protein n=1 Tax=Winogradskyella litoriviva TaxID=1220182 RepID=A0ABX2E4E4_9FLAO|nr:glycosyltransferase family 2 protein [Winogradskyella litoriviva]NRD23235.1 glycosyltransferase family 2 protein [Winogradskyella litoriviva]
MLISIIIPFYKNSKDIKRALQSVFAQTLQEFEIILVNDASPDWHEALTIINNFKDSRLTTISHQINKNGSSARNTGIKVAKGDYIAFLDADDEWLPNHLRESLEFVKVNNLDLASSKVKIINQKGVFFSPSKQKNNDERVATFLFVKGMAMYTPSLFCKSLLAQDVLFDETIKRHQDFDFLLRAENKKYELGTSPHVGAIVHWENNNPITKGETWKFSQEWLLNRKELLRAREFDNFWLQFIGFKILDQNKWLFVKAYFKNKINPFNLNKSRVKVLILKFLK